VDGIRSGPISDSGPNSAVTNSLPAANQQNQIDAWHENLVRERQVEIRLRKALNDLDAGRLVAAIAGLQAIIDRDDDVFIRFPSELVPCGAHFLASRILGSLSSRTLATYETLYGREAGQLLTAALAQPDPDLLAAVVRRFYHTAAGFEAGSRLADFWTNHGCDELAWGWWQRALREPVHHERVQAVHCVRAASCCKRLGRLAAAREILEQRADRETVLVAGRDISIGTLLARLSHTAGGAATTADSPALGGQLPGQPTDDGSPPALAFPLWKGMLSGEQSRHIETLARLWQDFQLQNGLPIGTSQVPIVVGDRLVYRDYEGLRVADIRTGKSLSFYRCASSLSQEISPRQTIPSDGNPDPNNMMRHVVGSGMGMLASDGRHIFLIDGAEADGPQPHGAAPPHGETAGWPRQTNLLQAFDLGAGTGDIKARWTVGGPVSSDGKSRNLAGHYFLGPPLAVEGRLFALSESNELLYLSCLNSGDGSLAWSQVLCSVPQPIGADHQRAALTCSPAHSSGMLVCPTQVGVVVAVDSLSGRLLWAASYDDSEPQQRQQITAWPYNARRRIGHPGYINLPIIQHSSVVYLPPHSEHIHCFDLATGRTRWRAPRHDLEPSSATEYVAAATDEAVLIVGRKKCRSLSLDSGTEKWAFRLGSTPAGRGVRLGDQYHVPLDDGRIVSLPLDSGRGSAAPAPLGVTHLGNLVAGQDVIVSMGAGSIAVYPQAQRVLHDLDADLKAATADPARILQAAELELTLGRFDQAEQHLEAVLRSPAGTPELQRASALARALVAQSALDPNSRTEDLLERLSQLSAAPAEHGHYLQERWRLGTHLRAAGHALAAACELASMDLEPGLEAVDDPSLRAAPHILAAGLIQRSSGTVAPNRRAFETQLGADLAAALSARDLNLARRLIRICGDPGRADEARLHVARLLFDQKRFQEAETVLLTCRKSTVPSIVATATRLLADLWTQQGLYHDAALLMSELGTKFADIRIAPDHNGRTWLAAFPRDTAAYEAYRRLAPPAWETAGVTVVENRVTNDALQGTYNGNAVLYLPTPRQSPFDLFDRGRGAAGVFNVFDRHNGHEYPETIHVPGRFFYPVSTQTGHLQHSHVGQFFPLGGTGLLYGVSLLERRLLWTTVPPELSGVKEVVRVGPADTDFCTFQYRQHLYVVDPTDGRILWHRDDLEPTSGLMGPDPCFGIIGDSAVLVVFASNGANYTVYDTASGAELRRGKLDILTSRLPRRAMGRYLLHCTAAADTRRMRVWDAATDRFVWDEPANQIAEASVLEGVAPGTKIFAFVRDTDEAAFVTTSGTIRVVNLVSGKERFQVSIPAPGENLSYLRAFRDRERYYFNLQRSWPPGKAPSIPGYLVSDASLPCVHIQGELCAVDVTSQRLLWQRTLGNRSLVYLPDFPLPVLVSLCRLRTHDQSSLSVEVLDTKSGQTLSGRDDILSDRLLQALYDRQAGLIELRGAKTSVRLEFPPIVARLDATNPPAFRQMPAASATANPVRNTTAQR
jgi:outer membrane protein assembly factor BamB